MASVNPLSLLLDGLLSQDRDSVQIAMRQVRALFPPTEPIGTAQSSEDNVYLLVRAVLRYHPALASIASGEGSSLPLHYAAALGYVDVARALILQFRDAIWFPNRKGKIPLHFAAREGRTAIVYMLTQACPDTARIPSKKAKLALHFAVSEGHSKIVERLLECYPEGALQASSKGKLPLHFACRWGHMTIARKLIGLHPVSVCTLDWEGSLPIHDAARQGQVTICKFLAEQYPKGLAIANLRGEIPLFSAVRSGNLDLLICLVQAWPRGALYVLQNLAEHDSVETWNPVILELCLRGASMNFTECTALQGRRVPVLCDVDHVIHTESMQGHAADDSDKNEARISLKSIRNENNAAVSERKHAAALDGELNNGSRKRQRQEVEQNHRSRPFLALHTALETKASSQVLRHVLSHNRGQMTQQDASGQLPLHLAMMHCRTEACIQIVLDELLQSHPESSMVKDNQGCLPLHVGILSRGDFRLIRGVLASNPLSGETTLSVGNEQQPPPMVAASRDCDLSTVYLLLRYDPSVIRAE